MFFLLSALPQSSAPAMTPEAVGLLLVIAAVAGLLFWRATGGRVLRTAAQAAGVFIGIALVALIVFGPWKITDARSSVSALWTWVNPASSPLPSDVITRTVAIGPGGTLTVDAAVGSIEVRTSERSDVHVEVHRSGELIEVLDVGIKQEGHIVRITASLPANRRLSMRRASARFVVEVPAQFDVDVHTRGGSIQVADLVGTVSAKTSGGSIQVGDVEGPVQVNTSGGSIRLAGATGDADLRTSGGSIRVGKVGGNLAVRTSGGSISLGDVGGRVDAQTSGGSITCNLTRAITDGVSLRTSGGSIRVRVAEGIAASVDASTSAGRVTSAFHDQAGDRRSSLKDVINGGGPALSLRTTAGSINIERL
jgi:hypothetical protein